MKTLKDLMIHEIQDLISAESQLIDAMPQIKESVTDHELKSMLDELLVNTEKHKNRLAEACAKLNVDAEAETCKAMAGLIRETKDMIKMEADDEVKDAGMIAEMQRIEHYQIAGYGSACTYAEMLGEETVLQLLKATLSEEKEADEKLKKLAKAKINQDAMA